MLIFIARRTPDRALAEDVLAETFTVAWRRRQEIPEPGLPWLLGVARRLLANQLRGARRAENLAEKLASEPSRSHADPSDLVIGRSSALQAFNRLSESERETLRLIAWDGLGTAEAARILGCSRPAFRVRAHRARKKLARELEAEENPSTSSATSPLETKEELT